MRTIKLAVDKATRRPLCALFQAVYGGDSVQLSRLIPGELWQLSQPELPRMVEGTEDQWRDWAADELRKQTCVRKNGETIGVS